jgi:hypothetical protein
MQQTPVPPLPPDLPVIPQVFVDSGPPVGAVIAVVFLVVAGIVFFPLVRAYARRLERGSAGGADAGELEQLRARVAELEALHHRVAELEERVDFSERMLTQRAPGALPRGARE